LRDFRSVLAQTGAAAAIDDFVLQYFQQIGTWKLAYGKNSLTDGRRVRQN
jgi:hypothetical protein